jgi:putative ABC transport system permease protein
VDPIGKRLTWPDGGATVIGIVPETRYRDLRDPRRTVYFPLRQSSFPFAPMTLAIRIDGSSANVTPTIRRTIAETEPGVELLSATPFGTFLERPLAQPRLNTFLLFMFAFGAVTLAAVGLFSIMAAAVRQRTRELGIRMALGATATSVGGLVLRRGLTLAALGTLLGLLAAFALNHLLSAMTFEISPTDIITLAIAAALLLCVAALASVLPARWSARVDPLVALQAD